VVEEAVVAVAEVSQVVVPVEYFISL